MRPGIAAALLALCAVNAHGLEVAATGISMPFFNESGQLTHRMSATRGALVGAVRRLEEVQIEYYSPTEPNVILQKLTADEATWDEQKEVLTGKRGIVVVTEENRLTGEGFDFALATSLLHIHRNFRMENREMILTSDRATAEMLLAKEGANLQFRDVKRCEATGNLQIVIQPTATRTYDFKRASSEIAVYEGSTKVVTLPKPIRFFDQKENESRRLNQIEIKVGPKTPPAAH